MKGKSPDQDLPEPDVFHQRFFQLVFETIDQPVQLPEVAGEAAVAVHRIASNFPTWLFLLSFLKYPSFHSGGQSLFFLSS